MYAGADLYDVQVECARRCLRVDLVGTLWAFYTRHNAAKCATIPDILEEWAGAEDDLLSELRAKYGNAALATAVAAAAASPSPPRLAAGPPPTYPSPSRGDDPQRMLLNNIIRRDTSPLVQRQRPYSRSPVRGRNGPGNHNHNHNHHGGGMSPDSLAQRRLLGSVLADSPPHADPTRGQSPDVDHTLLRQEATDEARMDLEVAREHAKLRAAAAAGGGGGGGESAAAAAGLPGSPAFPRRASPVGGNSRRSFSPSAFLPASGVGGGDDDDIARFAADALRGIPQLAAASARRPPRVTGGSLAASHARAPPARALAGVFPEAAAADAVSAGLDRSLDQLEEALEVVRRKPVQAAAYRPLLTQQQQQQQQQRTFPATAAADAAAAAVPTGDAAIPPSSRTLIAQLAGFLNGGGSSAGGSPPRGAREAEQAVRVRLFDDAATPNGGGPPPDAAEQRYRNLLQDLSAYQDRVEGVVRRPIDSEKRIRAAERGGEARAEQRHPGGDAGPQPSGVSPRDAEILRGLGLSRDEIALLAPPELSHRHQAAPAAAVSPTQPLRPAEQAHASRLRGSSPPPQHDDAALPPPPRLLVWGVRSSSSGGGRVEVDLSERFDGVLMSDMAYLFVSLADAARPCEAWYWIGRDATQAVADAAFSHACTKVHAVAPLAPQRRVFEGEEPPEFLVMLSARGVELSLFLRTPITRSPGSLKLLVVKPFSSAHLCVAELPCCLEAVADRTAATPGAAHYFLLLSHDGLWVLGDAAGTAQLAGGGVSPALLGQKFTGRCPHLAYRGCQPLGRASALGLRPADPAQRRALDATLVRRLAYQSLVIQPLLLRVRHAGGDGAAPAAAEAEACSFTVLNVRRTGDRVALQDVRAGLTDPLGGGVVALIAHRTALRVWVRAGGPRPPSPVERATHLAACDAFIAQNGLPPDFPVVLAFEGAEPSGFFPSDMFC